MEPSEEVMLRPAGGRPGPPGGLFLDLKPKKDMLSTPRRRGDGWVYGTEWCQEHMRPEIVWSEIEWIVRGWSPSHFLKREDLRAQARVVAAGGRGLCPAMIQWYG